MIAVFASSWFDVGVLLVNQTISTVSEMSAMDRNVLPDR